MILSLCGSLALSYEGTYLLCLDSGTVQFLCLYSSAGRFAHLHVKMCYHGPHRQGALESVR